MNDVDLSVYDVTKCFDKLWLEESLNDLYEAGLTNDKLILLYKLNENNSVGVRTPRYGLTERFEVENLVMQGTNFASLFALE